MKQDMHATTQEHLALRLWQYISKPFQITKVLEILYMLNWMWYAFLSIIPNYLVSGLVFNEIQQVANSRAVTFIIMCLTFSHILALLLNIIILRKINLMLNIAMLLYISAKSLQNLPISSGVGYLVILAGVSIFAFLRMDKSH